MQISVMQMCPGHDKAANIAQARAIFDAAPDLRGFVCLPEMWSCLGGNRSTKFEQSETLPGFGSGAVGGAAYEFLRQTALARGIVVHGGSICERGEGAEAGRLFNTTLVFDPDGREIARYRKIHLFDIVTPDGTGYRESATYGAGQEIVTYQAQGITVGCTICYDMRFGEVFLSLRQRGAELIFAPAAFTVPTGQAHWHVLLRARAIETQSWIAASATVGEHIDAKGETRATFGHSLICDPWGQVVAEKPEGIGLATAAMDRAATARIRRDMPVLEHRHARDVAALSAFAA
ncbi:MAG: carbon-nitrogen hydrolase family protein [Acetobacteraceae bacterium]|nr:carbon-nitrogen hydrolase family protein [Acetobacteraceae bacterium]